MTTNIDQLTEWRQTACIVTSGALFVDSSGEHETKHSREGTPKEGMRHVLSPNKRYTTVLYAQVYFIGVMGKNINAHSAKQVTGSKRARTRTRLIDAAAAIVGEKGFHATTLNEIAASAGVTRGAIYGNFRNREDLFLAVVKHRWEPIVPELKPGGTFREQMRAIGEAVVAAAPLRQTRAVGALSFQIYALTHPEMRARIEKQNAEIYRHMAAELTGFVPPSDLPIPVEKFIPVIHALMDGLLFKRFLTPNLITDDTILAAFEMLAPKPAIRANRRRPPSSKQKK